MQNATNGIIRGKSVVDLPSNKSSELVELILLEW